MPGPFRLRIDLNFVHSIDRELVDGEVAAMVTYFLRDLLVEVLRAAAHCAVNPRIRDGVGHGMILIMI